MLRSSFSEIHWGTCCSLAVIKEYHAFSKRKMAGNLYILQLEIVV